MKTDTRLDHPDGNDIIFGIDGRQLGTHTEDRTIATRYGRLVKVSEGADQLTAGVDGTLDFQRMEYTVPRQS